MCRPVCRSEFSGKMFFLSRLNRDRQITLPFPSVLDYFQLKFTPRCKHLGSNFIQRALLGSLEWVGPGVESLFTVLSMIDQIHRIPALMNNDNNNS